MSMPLAPLDAPQAYYPLSTSTSLEHLSPARRSSQSLSITQQRDSLALELLYEVFKHRQEADWDGYNAEPISIASCSEAFKFLTILPLTADMPEILPDPDGSIALEWYLAKNRIVVLSFNGTGTIHYAGIFGTNKEVHGKEPLESPIPKAIIEIIQRLFR